ncbi:hypothetical protein FANTH_10679 [Fusarium anthophilum]|uniref:Uncharacterized protein n=1 Tax=Fusarium anthophilum TaxID=48485 RepID=A0A8H4Z0N2_9HYPO|nr:hypothetical protein FANTH_10679 [Fusarium anthophilum]
MGNKRPGRDERRVMDALRAIYNQPPGCSTPPPEFERLPQRLRRDLDGIFAARAAAGIDMSKTETHAKETAAAAKRTAAAKEMARKKTEIKQRLEKHDNAIEENGKVIAEAGNKAFKMEPAVEKLENELDFEEYGLSTFDDLDRYERRGWDLLGDTKSEYILSRELRSLIDENYKLKFQIDAHKSIYNPQSFVQKQQKAALDLQKDAIEQLRPTIGAMRDRLYEVEIVAHQSKGTEKDL